MFFIFYCEFSLSYFFFFYSFYSFTNLSLLPRIHTYDQCVHIFLYKQLHFPYQPGAAKEIWGNEAKSCLAVAYVLGCFLREINEYGHF